MYFCSRFQGMKSPRRYAPTADMNVRNSIGMQGMCSGSRVLAWTVSISLFQGNSHDLYQKKRHTVPRFVYFGCSIGH